MKPFVYLAAAALGAASLAFAQPAVTAEQAVATGNKAASELLKTLGGELKKHMKAGGPIQAVHFCSAEAASLTANVDKKQGEKVAVKRITLQPRNPVNAPENDEKEILQALATMKKNGVELPAYLLQSVDGGYKYYKPLTIAKPVCLKCHGDAKTLAPKVKAEIAKSYPTDTATGYRLGDFRGAILVTVKP